MSAKSDDTHVLFNYESGLNILTEVKNQFYKIMNRECFAFLVGVWVVSVVYKREKGRRG